MAALVPDVPNVEIAIVELTNAFRAEQKLAPVKLNAKLTAAARAYAKFLASSDLFSHTADGRQHSDRIKSAGYEYCEASENLALNRDDRGFETRQLARDAVEGWKESPGHRRNLVSPHITEIGVGVAKARDKEKYLSVQLFGRPQSLMYTFDIKNELRQPVTYTFGTDTHVIKPNVIDTHTACEPASIVFQRAGPPTSGKTLNGGYTARDGDVYRLRASKSGDIQIEVTPKGGSDARGMLDQ